MLALILLAIFGAVLGAVAFGTGMLMAAAYSDWELHRDRKRRRHS